MSAAVVVIGNHYWGSGETLAAAKAEFRRQGGKLSNGYAEVVFGDGSEFQGVDQMGRVSWTGPHPTVTQHKPRGRK